MVAIHVVHFITGTLCRGSPCLCGASRESSRAGCGLLPTPSVDLPSPVSGPVDPVWNQPPREPELWHGCCLPSGWEMARLMLDPPAADGVKADTVDRIDTHRSVAFLVGDRAYTLERAVRYGLMDCSTPERRRKVASQRSNGRSAGFSRKETSSGWSPTTLLDRPARPRPTAPSAVGNRRASAGLGPAESITELFFPQPAASSPPYWITLAIPAPVV